MRTALSNANVDQAKGNIDSPRQAFTIWANDQLLAADVYKPVVVAYRNGAPVRLSDVATVVDGTENIRQAAWMNDKPAVIVNIQRQPGANIITVVDRVEKLLPELKASLPASVDVSTLTDRTTTIRASVQDTGSELRRPLGISIVGGLIVSQVLTLFTTPVVYLAFDRMAKRLRVHSTETIRAEEPAD